jgi:aldehyde:ferredoxin oxidoreductase
LGPETKDYALHVKGLELPGYDVRGAISMGLNYATTYVGSDHNRGYASQEVFGTSDPISVDRFALDDKAALTKWNQDMKTALCDCPTTCAFTLSVGAILDRVPEGLGDDLTDRRIETLTKLIGAATGIPYSPPEMRRLGERVNTLARAFNAREGFTRQDDTLPKRLMEEPIKAGASKGQIFTQEKLDQLLEEYYDLYGYDEKGIPTRDRLETLGLGPVADELSQLGLISR